MSITIPFLNLSDLKRYIKNQVNDGKDGEKGDFASALNLDVSHIDERATLEGIRITSVEEVDEKLEVAYIVDYHVFHSCRDIEGNGELEDSVTGIKTSDGWAFEVNKSIEKRSTLDEF